MESPAVQKNKTECKMAIRNEEPHVNKCFPRARGDVPIYSPQRLARGEFSPRTRGCSLFWWENWVDFYRFPRARGDVPAGKNWRRVTSPVFPAHAGMFPHDDGGDAGGGGFPRARGDVPNLR